MDSERQTMPLTATSQVSTARKVNFANSDKLQNSILPEFAQHAVFVCTAVQGLEPRLVVVKAFYRYIILLVRF